MTKKQTNELPLYTKIELFLEKKGTDAIATIVKKDKQTDLIHSVYDIPYSQDKTNKNRQFDWHCPRIIADSKNYAPTPVLFYAHGGSWSAADKSIFTVLAKDFAEQGIIVVNMNYRLMPEDRFEDSYADVVECVQFCLSHADMLGIDPNFVFFGGDSAGAHLASLVCAKATSGHLKLNCTIRGTFLFYGVYDLKNLSTVNFRTCRILGKGFTKMYEGREEELLAFYNEYSPIEFVTKDFPASFLTAGKIDHLTKSETETFVAKLKELGVECHAKIFPKNRLDARHAFVNIMLKARKEALDIAFKFLHSKIDNRLIGKIDEKTEKIENDKIDDK